MLKVGRKAPAFSLPDQNNELHNLKSVIGKWAVIYFYPKDDTPGCTKEACTIAEIYKDFAKIKVTVFGVSKDTVRSHKKFADKYQLPFTLLADTTTEMIADYQALAEKSMFGKKYLGIIRISYVISPDGKIAAVYPEVDPATHALLLLKDIKKLIKDAKAAQGM